MSNPLNKLAVEFNRYFTSSNGVDVPAKVSVSRDEWRALFTAIQQAESVPVAYVCPTSHHAHDGSMKDGPDYLEWADEASDYEKRVGTPLYTHPAPGVPEGYVLVKFDDMVRLASLIGPAPFEQNGKTYTFNVPNPDENLRLISATVRAMLASPAQKP